MTEKVKIPQSVADAYTDLEAGWSLTDIFKMVTADFTVSDSRVQTLVEWNETGRCDEGAGLMQLLLGQYEVEPEYKAQDWIVSYEDNLGVIESVEDHVLHGSWFDRKGKTFPMKCYFTNVKRHATPEEIKAEKERRAWAKIGREVGEFKTNDVVLNQHGLPIRVFDKEVADDVLRRYQGGSVKGFYPAESFISFEDGDEA